MRSACSVLGGGYGVGVAEVAAAGDLELATEDSGDGFGVGEVFLFEDAGGEGGGVVVFVDGDGALEDDDAVVDVLVDEVDGAAGDVDAEGQGLLLRVEAGEGREQGRVDVDDAVGEGGDKGWRDDAHVAGEADEVDFVLVEAGDELGVVGGAGLGGAAFGGDGEGGEVEVAGGGEAGCVGAVGEDAGDLGGVETVEADGFGDSEKVGAASGEEDA